MDDLELEGMKAQISILKKKLENESIVNEKMMRSVLNTKVDSLRMKKRIETICAIFVIMVGPLSFKNAIGCSWYFLIATDLLMIYCILRNKFMYDPVTRNDLMSGNLLEVATKMEKFKKELKKYKLISIPIMFVWFIWLEWEIYNNGIISGNDGYMTMMMIATSLGLVIGMTIGLLMLKSASNTATEVIRQIRD